ncbi:uncharacterized protein LOC122657399 [Telopea speciosissima]|uniref:uncharacterized protein LOC122657399 n=1 Tax=Telopea speciosissima TaxID=54955 RepID=UPI001CC70942|nr:uncharacterized protein LOC122657399 [Telopea speciosissima]
MAGYGYKNRGYVAQEKSRSGTTIQPWGSSYNGVEERSDQWRNTGFPTNYEGCQDHRCSPVIIDAEGRKHAIVACTPEDNTQYIVTKRETRGEQVHAPLVTRYKDSSPTRMGPTKDYGTIKKEWSSPVNPSYERPPIVDEFIGKVQTEASRPTRMGPLNGAYWRRTPNPPCHDGTNGYCDRTQDPTVITTGGWTRPSRVGWATPPSYDSPLGKPTNDIGTAVEYIKEATKPSYDKTFTTEPRFTVPSPAVPRVNFSPPTPAIDSKEAARRYNGLMLKADT